jgi:hypothetical protein
VLIGLMLFADSVRRLLRHLLRRPAAAPGFGPLPAHARTVRTGDGWVKEPHGPGVWHHHPESPTPVQYGPAIDPLAPPPQPHTRPPRPSEVLRAAGCRTFSLWHDGTEAPR